MVFTSWLCLHRNTDLVGTMIPVYYGMLQELSWGHPCPGAWVPPMGPQVATFVSHFVSAALRASY